MCISVSVSVCTRAIVGKRKKDDRERERSSERACVLTCNHLTANGRSERLWHHAGLQSCGLTSTANQQTACASQWMTAKSLGDEASCWGQRAVVLTLHQCTDKNRNSTPMPRIADDAPSSQAFPSTNQATLQQHKHGVGVWRPSRERGGWGISCMGRLGEVEVEVDPTVSFKAVSINAGVGKPTAQPRIKSFYTPFDAQMDEVDSPAPPDPPMLPPVIEPTPLPRPSGTEDELENGLSPFFLFL